ncbi:hypothetical protein LEN26_005814 [Aphanomyces euteiches]|nr:hypothetical protein AeMF1_015883 [Aphanomyces euteiches]KAH9137294.1 hypothetical protein LEN26_005814 [Aphanomyces euteiches]KAH9195415.1 hypothetical protein AeNC1_002623 [Aphanomyces euteiches]
MMWWKELIHNGKRCRSVSDLADIMDWSVTFRQSAGVGYVVKADDKLKMTQDKKSIGAVSVAVIAILLTAFSSLWFAPQRGLPVKQWHDNLLAELHDTRMPLLIQDSPTQMWNTSHWTLQHVVSKFATWPLSIHEASPPVFKHYDPNLELATKFPPPFNTSKASNKHQVMALLKSRNASVGYYINDELKRIAPDLGRDIHPVKPFVTHSAAGSTFVKLWVGGPRVIANLHYDATHSIFHQVDGEKRFILFPPSSFQHLYVYSRLHPSHRQSQLDLTQPSSILASFPLYQNAAAHRIDVTLKPGDTMYLPPFWFHCVITDAPSVSINVWSDSPELQIFHRVLQNPVPYLSDFEARGWVYDLPTHLFGLQLFVTKLLARSVPQSKQFVDAYVDSQRRTGIPIESFECGQASSKAIDEKMNQAMKIVVRSLVKDSFGQMKASSAAILVMSFIEALLAQYIDPLYVPSFLNSCI